jgi:hypothetical protein
MNAAEHLQQAVQLLASVPVNGAGSVASTASLRVQLAQAHAVCALAIELGVPPAAVSVSGNVTPIKPPPDQADNGDEQNDDMEATG